MYLLFKTLPSEIISNTNELLIPAGEASSFRAKISLDAKPNLQDKTHSKTKSECERFFNKQLKNRLNTDVDEDLRKECSELIKNNPITGVAACKKLILDPNLSKKDKEFLLIALIESSPEIAVEFCRELATARPGSQVLSKVALRGLRYVAFDSKATDANRIKAINCIASEFPKDAKELFYSIFRSRATSSTVAVAAAEALFAVSPEQFGKDLEGDISICVNPSLKNFFESRKDFLKDILSNSNADPIVALTLASQFPLFITSKDVLKWLKNNKSEPRSLEYALSEMATPLPDTIKNAFSDFLKLKIDRATSKYESNTQIQIAAFNLTQGDKSALPILMSCLLNQDLKSADRPVPNINELVGSLMKDSAGYELVATSLREIIATNVDSNPAIAQDAQAYLNLLPQCEKLHIQLPFRYPPKLLEQIIEQRTNPEKEGEKVAVIIMPRGDPNGAFDDFNNTITELMDKGYRVKVIEASSPQEMVDAVKRETSINKASVLQVGGHGEKDQITLGVSSESNSSITLKDLELLKSLDNCITSDAHVILLSCSTASDQIDYEYDPINPQNMLQLFRVALKNPPKDHIYAPSAPSNTILHYVFDDNGLVLDIIMDVMNGGKIFKLEP